MATNVSSGSGSGGGGEEEETLTQTQKEILVELRKSLGTLRVINEILVKTIAVAGGTGGDDSLGGSSGDGGGGGGLVEAQKEAAREVRRVIGSAVWKGGGDEGEGGSADLPVGAVAEGSTDEALK